MTRKLADARGAGAGAASAAAALRHLSCGDDVWAGICERIRTQAGRTTGQDRASSRSLLFPRQTRLYGKEGMGGRLCAIWLAPALCQPVFLARHGYLSLFAHIGARIALHAPLIAVKDESGAVQDAAPAAARLAAAAQRHLFPLLPAAAAARPLLYLRRG